MKSITNDVENEIIINKSRFITKLYKVNSINEVNNYLNELKNKYMDATHICYAYIIDNYKRSSDDNEPSGTAGIPILNVLEKNELNYILAVVIRYFGGIKLGAAGLFRAYSSSIKEALDNTSITSLLDGYLIRIEFNYDKVKLIDNLLKDINIINKEYNDLIIYEFEIDIDNNLDMIKNNVISFNILKKIKLTKKGF